jgi:hypothetical protein
VVISICLFYKADINIGKQGFLDDLRMVEDPVLSRGDKLRVLERIWRCWGIDGRRKT